MTVDDLARLHKSAFTRQRAWTAEEFRALLAQPRVLLTSTREGFGLIRILAPEAELLTLAVAPAEQGKGVGRRLLQTLLSAARSFDAPEMFLEVAADNAPARTLYERSGFAETGVRAGYYKYPDGSTSDAILMRHIAR